MIRRDYDRMDEWTDDELREWFYWFHDHTQSGWTFVDDDGTSHIVTNVEMALYVRAAHLVRGDMQTAEEIAAFLKGTARGERIEKHQHR